MKRSYCYFVQEHLYNKATGKMDFCHVTLFWSHTKARKFALDIYRRFRKRPRGIPQWRGGINGAEQYSCQNDTHRLWVLIMWADIN